MKAGARRVTVSAVSDITRIWFPLGLGIMNLAPATGIVAVTAELGRFTCTTAPGDCPVIGALGMAAKSVVSSLATNILSVGPGRVTAEVALSVALSTIPKVLLE